MLFQPYYNISTRYQVGDPHPVRSAEHVAAAQHDARVSKASRNAHRIEKFQNADRQVAADTRPVLEGRSGERALRRAVSEVAGDSAKRASVSGRKKRLSATRAPRPSRSARERNRSTASGSSPSVAASSRTRGGRWSSTS